MDIIRQMISVYRSLAKRKLQDFKNRAARGSGNSTSQQFNNPVARAARAPWRAKGYTGLAKIIVANQPRARCVRVRKYSET